MTVSLGIAIDDQSPSVGIEMVALLTAYQPRTGSRGSISLLACFAESRLLGEREGDEKRGKAQLGQKRRHIVRSRSNGRTKKD